MTYKHFFRNYFWCVVSAKYFLGIQKQIVFFFLNKHIIVRWLIVSVFCHKMKTFKLLLFKIVPQNLQKVSLWKIKQKLQKKTLLSSPGNKKKMYIQTTYPVYAYQKTNRLFQSQKYHKGSQVRFSHELLFYVHLWIFINLIV